VLPADHPASAKSVELQVGGKVYTGVLPAGARANKAVRWRFVKVAGKFDVEAVKLL
jgi:hypothetical protein